MQIKSLLGTKKKYYQFKKLFRNLIFTLPASAEVQLGLRTLMFVFPAVALGIAILSIYKYPLDGERLIKVKEDLQKIHEEKKLKV